MELVERPVQFVRRQMAEGRNAASVASDLIQKADGDKELEQESVIKWTAASLYTAGADTVGCSLLPPPFSQSPQFTSRVAIGMHC
jgi:hypothetical protein